MHDNAILSRSAYDQSTIRLMSKGNKWLAKSYLIIAVSNM